MHVTTAATTTVSLSYSTCISICRTQHMYNSCWMFIIVFSRNWILYLYIFYFVIWIHRVCFISFRFNLLYAFQPVDCFIIGFRSTSKIFRFKQNDKTHISAATAFYNSLSIIQFTWLLLCTFWLFPLLNVQNLDSFICLQFFCCLCWSLNMKNWLLLFEKIYIHTYTQKMKPRLENRQLWKVHVQTNGKKKIRTTNCVSHGKTWTCKQISQWLDIFATSVFFFLFRLFGYHQTINHFNHSFFGGQTTTDHSQSDLKCHIHTLCKHCEYLKFCKQYSNRGCLKCFDMPWASMRSSFITLKSTWNISTQINVLDPILILYMFAHNLFVCRLFCFAIRIKSYALLFGVDTWRSRILV